MQNQLMMQRNQHQAPWVTVHLDHCLLSIASTSSRMTGLHHHTNTTDLQWSGVGWLEFTIPFQHKHGYIRDERSGVQSYPLTQWRKASNILTSTLAIFLFSSDPKTERDWEANLNYYASTYNRGRQLSHCKTKLNQIQQNTRKNLNYLN